MTNSTPSSLLSQAHDLQKTDPKRAEALYKQILEQSVSGSSGSGQTNVEKEQNLRVQESALVSLGEVYRDAK